MALSVHRATTSPASPPAIARSIDSVSNCATMCLRPAPIDRRTAISVARAAARPRSRFATFAQQISSTNSVTQKRSVSGPPASSGARLWPCAPGPSVISMFLIALEASMGTCPGKAAGRRSYGLTGLAVEDRLRLLFGNAGLEPREEVRPERTAIVEPFRSRHDVFAHRDRHEDARPFAECRPVKALRRDADDRHRLAVHPYRLADNIRSGAEPPLPVVVTEDHDLSAARLPVIVGPEKAAEMGRQPQHGKIRTGHQCGVAAFRGPGIRDGCAEIAVRGNAGKRRLHPLEIAKHRVAENRIACAGRAARDRSASRARSDKVHEAIAAHEQVAGASRSD